MHKIRLFIFPFVFLKFMSYYSYFDSNAIHRIVEHEFLVHIYQIAHESSVISCRIKKKGTVYDDFQDEYNLLCSTSENVGYCI